MLYSDKRYVAILKSFGIIVIFFFGVASIIASGGSGNDSELSSTVAIAGKDQYVRTGSLVTLDGRNSDFRYPKKFRHNRISLNWAFTKKPSGSNAKFIDADIDSKRLQPQFIADVDGLYVIELTAINNSGTSGTDSVNVIATHGNRRPVADAGFSHEVAIGKTVQLKGSGYDPDGDMLTFEWSGQDAEQLSDTNNASPTFIATEDKAYEFKLTVNDGSLNSITDWVVIRANPEGDSYPNSIAGEDQFVTPGTVVQLDGSASHDVYGKPLNYHWQLLRAPGNRSVDIINADTPKASFTPITEGEYLLVLRIDNGVRSNGTLISPNYKKSDRLVIHVASNQPPVADGGDDHAIPVATSANLDASASYDPEAAALSYHWDVFRRPQNSTAQPIPNDSITTQFTPDLPGVYLLRLVVNDGELDSAPDIIRIDAEGETQATPLTVLTSLPYLPTNFEVATWIQINGSNKIQMTSSDSTPDAGFETLLEAVFSSPTEAAFNTYGTAWQLVDAPVNPVNQSSTPSFILKRTSDNRYFKLTFDFTVTPRATIQIDTFQGFDCGINPSNCP